MRHSSWPTALAVCLALLPLAALAAGRGSCTAPPGGVPIIAPLERFAARISEGGPLTIVAVGSSSTAGVGASGPEFNYPSRLEADLRASFPALDISVVNRGKGGEDAPEELARLSRDVVALHPDLAIWQVGTNAVLRRDDLVADGEWMREGVNLLKGSGIDVVLMDLQYAPRVIERPAHVAMEDLVAETADRARIGLFRRFALMRYWQSSPASEAPAMTGPDGLHMTDAGYGCLATQLSSALVANWRAETKLAHRVRNIGDSVAGLPLQSATRAAHSLPTIEMRRNDATPFN